MSNCGTEDLAVIVPSYNGIGNIKNIEASLNRNIDTTFCRYQIKFPMDANYGDNIKVIISNLKYVELTVGISTDFLYKDEDKDRF